jgi:6-phosphofructokinase 1
VRTACRYGIQVVGILRGYEGLMNNDVKIFDRRAVSGIINLGGTILKTARAKKFLTKNGQLQAIRTIKENQLDAIIVIGGNGSLTGAHVLCNKYSIPVVGIPATIDNDVNAVNMAIGADTAVNVALDAIDKIRDTSTSLERIFVVEVMGRDCGYIALQVALAGGCEEVIFPGKDWDIEKMSEEITEGNVAGKISWIVITAEGKAKAIDVARAITRMTGLETREVVLGHIQRGGRPTAFDRILAARYGNYALELVRQGRFGRCVGIKGTKLIDVPLAVAIKPKDIEAKSYYRLIKMLA